ncbi:hypothetical protein RLEG12_14825 [Rhizobium leguminosarum bv. trifolii CB782]|nr:hypothetical protein RLEG12_14825 [Rhizobium leguminosarum bv. trifolii CB782]
MSEEEPGSAVRRISFGFVCRPHVSQWRSITSAIDSALPQFGQPV